jgi:Glycosyltransferase family 87
MDERGPTVSTAKGHRPLQGLAGLSRLPDNWLADWRSTDRRTIYLYACWFFGASLFLLLFIFKSREAYLALAPGAHPKFGDFAALWSYGQPLAAHRGADLFRGDQLHDFQVALGMDPHHQAPFPYFPAFMFLFRPLALLSLAWSYLALSIGTLLLFAWVVAKTVSKAPWSILAVLTGPITVVGLACGQTGFLAAAFMTAGLRLMRSRPVLAGIAFGLLAFKPQLGLLVPVALLASGAWIPVIAASVTIAGLSAAASLCYGWQIWRDWLGQIPAYDTFFHKLTPTLPIQPTVAGNLHLLGFTDMVANSAQAVAALVVIALVWQCYRTASGRIADAALIAGTFLVTPHAFIYDMPMVTAALCLFVEDRLRTDGRFHAVEFLVMIITSVFPAVMFVLEPHIPISTICLVMLLAMILRRGNVTVPLPSCGWLVSGRLRTS